MVNLIPNVYVHLIDSLWPPAQGDYPVGYGRVVSFSSDRELASPLLAGQFAGSGFSVGDAQIVIAQPTSGKRLAPWASGDRRVTKGMRAHIYTAASPLGTVIDDYGTWIVESVSGSLVDGGVPLGLVEESKAGKVPHRLQPGVTDFPATDDAASIVDMLARQSGYFSTPPPTSAALASLPLRGSGRTDLPDLVEAGVTRRYFTDISAFWDTYPAEWADVLGGISPVGPFDVTEGIRGTEFYTAGTLTFTFTMTGTADFLISYGGPDFRIEPGGVLKVRNVAFGAWVTGSYVTGSDPNHPNRVEVQVERAGVAGAWTSARARARSSAVAAWGAWVTDATVDIDTAPWGYVFQVVATFNTSVVGLQVYAAANAAAWEPITAYIPVLESPLIAAYLPASVTAWDGVQEITQALGAATIIDDSVMRVIPFAELRGATTTSETIDVGADVEDLPWSFDSSSQADQLIFTYLPGGVQASTAITDIEIWSAQEVYAIPDGETITVDALVSGASNLHGPDVYDAPWLAGWDTTFLPEARGHRWGANPNRDGSGVQPADNALTVHIDPVSSGRFVLTITNNTTSTLYTVDPNGNPYLKLRAYLFAPQDTEAQVIRGLATGATNTLEVSAGRWVQDIATATFWADRIWGAVSQAAYSLNRVNVAVNPDRKLGDVVQLVHTSSDLDTKATITGIHDTNSAGGYGQELDLVRLSPTWFDFDAVWTGEQWAANFDTNWSLLDWADFDLDPLDQ